MEPQFFTQNSEASGWEPEKSFFKLIHVDVTHRCNMACANCYIPNRTIPDIDKERLFDLVSRLPHRTVLRLIGGEPTLRDDLPEIIEKILDFGHVVHLVTNGLKIADFDYLQTLKRAGLRYVYISMNGADQDSFYKVMDSGEFAAAKVKALSNVMKAQLLLSTGTIVARGKNEPVVAKQIELVLNTAKSISERKFNKSRMPEIRFRNIGPVGRYMKDSTLLLEELSHLVQFSSRQFGDYEPTNLQNGISKGSDGGILWTQMGPLAIKYTDWKTEEDFLAGQNAKRGRITKDFKIFYAAEDVKRNENGY